MISQGQLTVTSFCTQMIAGKEFFSATILKQKIGYSIFFVPSRTGIFGQRYFCKKEGLI